MRFRTLINALVVMLAVVMLSPAQAEAFYNVHKARPFFKSLVEFMTSGAVVVQVLEGLLRFEVLHGAEIIGARHKAQGKTLEWFSLSLAPRA